MKSKKIVINLFLILLLGSIPQAKAFYNPSAGRWLSRDPLTDEAFLREYGKHMKWKAQKHLRQQAKLPFYVFIKNSPQNHTDKHGLLGWWGNWCGPKRTGEKKSNRLIMIGKKTLIHARMMD